VVEGGGNRAAKPTSDDSGRSQRPARPAAAGAGHRTDAATRSDASRAADACIEEPITIVYLAYGPPRLARCTAFSALTLMHAAADLPRPWRIAIYTDTPRVFRRTGLDADFIPLESLPVEPDAPAYPHRCKVLALRDAACKYDGDLFYVDGDTYFRKSPEEAFALLASDRSIMHEHELVMTDGSIVHEPEHGGGRGEKRDLLHTIRDNDFQAPAMLAAQSRAELPMWNAGAIGIAAANKHLIAEALAISDELYAVYGYHICEQFAWSAVLAQVGEISPATDILHHYWRGKEEMTHRVVRFLRRNRRLAAGDLAAAAYAFRPVESDSWEAPMSVRVRTFARALRNRAMSSRPLRAAGGSAQARQTEQAAVEASPEVL
jgi:hypothetical protein